MARGKIRLVAHIEHQGVAAVDELHRLGRADLRRAADEQAVDQRPQQHAAGHHGGAEQHHVPRVFLQKH